MRPCTAFVALLLLLAAARGELPRLSIIDAPAIQRGVPTELRVYGKSFGTGVELLVPFRADVKLASAGAETASFKVVTAADTPVGIYPVRIRSANGVSNLRLLTVTEVPVIRAKEPNGRYLQGRLDLEQAQRIDWPCIVTGGRLIRDIDVYRFTVKAGQRLVFVTETRRVGLTPDPMLRILDSKGRSLARAHDTPGLMRDERIDHTFAEAGDYFLEVTSLDVGGWNNHYLLRIGAFDYVRTVFPLGGRRGSLTRFEITNRDGKTSTIEARVPADPHGDQWRLFLPDHPGSLPWPMASGEYPELKEDESRTEPQTVAWPATINGRIRKSDEEDLYRLAVKPGEHVRLAVEAYHLGSTLDGYLMVYDPVAKKLLASNDDQVGRGNPDPALTFQVPNGVKEVIVSLRDTAAGGGINHGYRLTVERGGPDFLLWLGKAQDTGRSNEENESWFRTDTSDTLSLPVGQEVKLLVSVRRSAKQNDPHYNGPIQGYQGDIAIKALDVPRGVTIKPGVIAAGKLSAELVCIATAEAPKTPFEIAIVGEATREDGSSIRRLAERRLYLGDPQSINLPWNWRVTKLTCVTTTPQR